MTVMLSKYKAIILAKPAACCWAAHCVATIALGPMASDPPVLAGPAASPAVGAQSQPVSESTEDAHSNAWALPTPDLNTAAHAAFFKTANGAMKHIHAHYGSPYNYLKEELKLGCGTPSDIAESLNLRNDFAHWMWTTFPEKEDQSYHHHG